MESEFLNNNNKGFLWDFLYKNGLFTKLSNNHLQEIKHLFETEMLKIKGANENKDVMSLNKLFLANIVQKITKYKNSEIDVTPHDSINRTTNPSTNYTYQAASAERQKLFQLKLNETQQEFNKHMKVDSPPDINFQDNSEENNEDLDKKLKEIVERRTKDLNMVVSNYDAPPNTKKLNIGNSAPLNDIETIDKPNKKVSFEEDNVNNAIKNNLENLFITNENHSKPSQNKQQKPSPDKSKESTELNKYQPKQNVNNINSFISQLKKKTINNDDVLHSKSSSQNIPNQASNSKNNSLTTDALTNENLSKIHSQLEKINDSLGIIINSFKNNH